MPKDIEDLACGRVVGFYSFNRKAEGLSKAFNQFFSASP